MAQVATITERSTHGGCTAGCNGHHFIQDASQVPGSARSLDGDTVARHDSPGLGAIRHEEMPLNDQPQLSNI